MSPSEAHQPAAGVACTAGVAIASRDLPAVPTTDPSWLLVEEGFNLAREHEVESRFTVANGYVGTRGSLAEGTRLSAPGTYVAGVFDVAPHPNGIPELVLAPDWTRLKIMVEGNELTLEAGEAQEHRRVLDLRQGMLWRQWRHREPNGRVTRLRFLRFASLADRHTLVQSLVITPENYSATLRVEGRIEQPVRQGASPGTEGPGLVPRPATSVALGSAGASAVLVWRTAATNVAIAIGAASRLRADDGDVVPGTAETGEGRLVERWEWESRLGSTYRLDRLVTIHTSRDGGRPDEAAAVHVAHLVNDRGERVAAAHAQSWQTRWHAADVAVEGAPEAQRALRVATYHLIGAANPEDAYVSVGARALTGDAYKGHVFWDTEIYLLPFYTFTWPEAARALLLYRHHTLPAAREKARRLGYAGALFAWESADSGEEATPAVVVTPEGEVVRILTGEQEHHISADVAYAVWQYWQATADDDFLREAGAEIVLETARFWASRGQVEADGRYHIRRVIGPDEYHEGVDDNAYTNGMAQWNLERGAEAARILGERWPERWKDLAERLDLSQEEIRRWPELARGMHVSRDPATGLIEQFQGYFGLEEIDLDAYPGRKVPMDVLLGRERIQRSQVLKQADVVLLLYLLWDRFPPPVRDANFRYYEPRTGHGSSLSPAIHALMAARLGDMELAQHFFQQAAEIDLANTMGNAAGGIHIAALGGLWQAAVFGFAGVRWDSNGLALDPHLPPGWRHLSFPLQWKGRSLHIQLTAEPATAAVSLEGGSAAVRLADGPPITLAPGRRVRTRRTNGRWERWREVAG
jgi:trehalose/maltose hydrolase-like predicted phosphorylase